MKIGIKIDPRNFDSRNLRHDSDIALDEIYDVDDQGMFRIIYACQLLRSAYAAFAPNPAIRFVYEDGRSWELPDETLAQLLVLKDRDWDAYVDFIKAILAIALELPHSDTPSNGRMQVFNIRRGSWDYKNDCVCFSTRDKEGNWKHTEEFFVEGDWLATHARSAVSLGYAPKDRLGIRKALQTFLSSNPLAT